MTKFLPQKTENQNINNSNANKNLWNARDTAINPIYYNARITREYPGAIVILVDQSASMDDEYKDGKSKAEVVASLINSILNEIVSRCQREGVIRNYFDILIIGYGQEINGLEAAPQICWQGNLTGEDWVKVADLKGNELETIISEKQVELPWGEIQTERTTTKIWLKPIANGLTPMKAGFELCLEKVEDWVFKNPNSYPPLIFNITDGYPTDVDDYIELEEVCTEIKSVNTKHGNVLLYNCLFTGEGEIIRYPLIDQKIQFEDYYHEVLFKCSSLMPNKMKQKLYEKYGNIDFINESPVGLIINSDLKSTIDLLNIGTNTLIDGME